ncbi:unnamed protein product [Phytophthora fragariaefolia]|uniref:Unnamed protein product n=1 Tax=Phytophthora fragariaefolia TaxID=1490495 RepID=A0A9W6TWF7_9STRA|nr:unnamed protein product [Phytophthora fragariaefolia]
MFPREQDAAFQGGHRGIPPPRLPVLQSPSSSLGKPGFIENFRRDVSSRSHETLSPANSSPNRQHRGSLHDQPRGRLVEEEGGMTRRPTLPSVATLLPPPRNVQHHRGIRPQLDAPEQQYHQLPELLQDRRRSQTHPQVYTPGYSVSSAPSPTVTSSGWAPALSGLSAFADPQLIGMQRSRYAASPSHRSSRWSPYATASIEPTRQYGAPWDEPDIDAVPNHRRRRTSPRRRLAASKAQARALQMSMHGRHVGALGQLENNEPAYRFHDKSYEDRPAPFAPHPPVPPIGIPLPMSMPLCPPPSPFVDETDTSPSKKSSRYLREMDRRTILARLDRGEKQSALAKEFRVTRAAICNLNKHRDLVLSRQHEDPLAKHPKKTKRRQDSGDDAEAEEVELSIRTGSNRVCLLLSEESPSAKSSRESTVHAVALQPAEHLIPLLLSSDTSDAVFRRYCDRLMTMVVEEVLAWAHTEAHNNMQASGEPPTPCGVSVAPGGSPMLSVFEALEPELPTGRIELSMPQVGSPVAVVLDLPVSVASHSVCLFYAFTDAVGGVRVAKSIRELLNRGAVEELLCLVTLAVSALTIGELQRAHPSMRIAAAYVESQQDIDDWIQYTSGLEKENQNDAGGESSQSTSRLELLASRVAGIY